MSWVRIIHDCCILFTMSSASGVTHPIGLFTLKYDYSCLALLVKKVHEVPTRVLLRQDCGVVLTCYHCWIFSQDNSFLTLTRVGPEKLPMLT